MKSGTQVLCLFAALLATGIVQAELPAKPNIIVIFTDDHGYADLSCQGIFDDVKTPHIDSLA
ncbi:MAG TPA: aryl-sulfate sulfohydrolase, partial [Phycisphaerales bacterium]|nr:aryl-sulfate sulfohydrolase [Phycisphaerales bacterium]